MNETLKHYNKIQPYDPSKNITVAEALKALSKCSFQGRNLGNALQILEIMANNKECLKVFTLSGAMIPAGMEEIICQLIEKKVINVIVTTGANIIHSIVNSFDETNEKQAHYIGSEKVDDGDLYEKRINRIYDTFLPETGFTTAEQGLLNIIKKKYEPNIQYMVSPSEFFQYIGNNLPGRSFLSIASRNNVPIFCGATSDSELGLNLMKYRKRNNLNIQLDELSDVENYAKIVKKYHTYGTIIVGGGVPRNWAQQIFPYLDQTRENNDDKTFDGFNYSVRFHTATQLDGGLSGCTINESISWGKYSNNSKHQSIWVDATIGLPLIVTALFQQLEK